MVEYVKIPKARVAVLIGEKGATRKEIEKATETKMQIDSDDGLVTIERTKAVEEGGDPLSEWTARDIVRAVGRGFNPEIALRIAEEDCVLEVVELRDHVKPGGMERIKGRIIGKEGKSKKYIEQMTGADVSVYGKTVAIIGDAQSAMAARDAVERLARGQKHATVFRFLEKHRGGR